MGEAARKRWDATHADAGTDGPDVPGPPSAFATHAELFPTTGRALDLACGRGRAAVWLAQRGMHVRGVDVSPVAIGMARHLAAAAGVADRCRLEVADLDDGLPPGPPVDLLLCHMFSAPHLAEAVVERLAPGGLLAIAVLSEVDAQPGRFRAPRRALRTAYGSLDVIAEAEGDGRASLLARRP